MKRSEIIQDIATEIIIFDHKIDFSKAQLLGDMILTRIEKEGMLPPYLTKDRRYPDTLNQHNWEFEDESGS